LPENDIKGYLGFTEEKIWLAYKKGLELSLNFLMGHRSFEATPSKHLPIHIFT
jgi:hypothetical protein